MIADKRDVLARNLVRAPLEVWPAAAEHAGYVDLWVADPGSTERAAPPYPLLHDGLADVFDGVPLGVSQRGDVIAVELPGANLVYGGLMGQGKSNAARVTMLGAALDPLAVLWVFVFANNGDFDAYQPRLARYHRGVDDDIAVAALDGLRELYADGQRPRRPGWPTWARRRSPAPWPNGIRSCGRWWRCSPSVTNCSATPTYGREAADLAVQTLRRGRKTAITLAFDTQSSRADAIPPRIVELVKINACFAVKAWRSNDGFLGDGSFQAGIRATELRPGKDVGTSIVTGATPERFEIVKWFYIEADDDTGYDAAADVIARAMGYLDPRADRRDRRPEPPGSSHGTCWPIWSRCWASSGCPPLMCPPGFGIWRPTTRRTEGSPGSSCARSWNASTGSRWPRPATATRSTRTRSEPASPSARRTAPTIGRVSHARSPPRCRCGPLRRSGATPVST